MEVGPSSPSPTALFPAMVGQAARSHGQRRGAEGNASASAFPPAPAI
jgi:hypothetical protein